MAQTNELPQHLLLPVVIVVTIAIGLLAIIAGAVQNGAGPTVSQASRNTTLTPGDDPLSLQHDLQVLERDSTVEDERMLNTTQ